MEISEVLQKSGLNQKEASIYLALLELGTAAVQSIAQRAGIKRPTTYLILDDLQEKGLVSVVPRAKKALYVAESPERLIADLNRQEGLLKRFLPELLAIHNTKKEKPKVQLFEGKENVKHVYDKIFSSKEVYFFATIRDFINFYPEFAEILKQKTKTGEIRVREILTQSPADLAFAKTVEHNEFYQQRLAPEAKEFLTDNAIFGDSVVFFSYDPYIFAVMITSRSISQSLKILFEMAWQSAQELPDLKK